MSKKIEETKDNKKNTIAKKASTSSTTTKKKNSTKKSTLATKSTNSKKTTKSKKSNSKANTQISSTKKTTKTKKAEIIEYYDLPYRYNQTVVKVLAQTPNTLFVYWDISDEDRKKYEEKYGKDFFTTTKPILIVHNKTLNYHFEIEINDFANSWYLHINDSKCDYHIELGRKPIEEKKSAFPQEYIHISSSNNIETPNDHILFNSKNSMVYFRNVKTNTQTSKSIAQLSLIYPVEKIQSVRNFYDKVYTKEDLQEDSRPSSQIKHY